MTTITPTDIQVYVKQFNSTAYSPDDLEVMITDAETQVISQIPSLSGQVALLDELVKKLVIYRLAFLLNKPDAKQLKDEVDARMNEIRNQLHPNNFGAIDKSGIRTQGRVPNHMRTDHAQYAPFDREPQ